jgi:hypothetical protein
MALNISNQAKSLAQSKRYQEFSTMVANDNRVSLNDSNVKREIDNAYVSYSSVAPTTGNDDKGSGFKETAKSVTQGASDIFKGTLTNQSILQQNMGYSMSSLPQSEAIDFSSVYDSIEQSVKKGEGAVDVMKNLLGSLLMGVGEQINDQLGKEIQLRNKVNSELGMTGELSKGFRDNILEAAPAATQMAFSFEELSNFAVDLSKNTGRMVAFNKDTLVDAQKTARAFYGDLRSLGSALDSFEKIGTGAQAAITQIDKAGKSSLELGLNARKVVESLSSNLNKMNQYGFKDGVEGLTKMTQKSIEFRMNMDSVFRLADDLFDPDKAIALSAELQAIGGTIGDFNDPLKLMYMATNDAGGLQDAMIGVAGSLATYNQELGKFEITGANLRKAKELSKQLGMSMEDLTNTAIKSQERTSASAELMSKGFALSDKEKEFLTNISRMEGGKMVVDVSSISKEFGGAQQIALDELTETQKNVLLKNQEAFEKMSPEEIARDQYTVTQNIQKDLSAMLTLAKVNAAKGFRGGLDAVDKLLEEKAGDKLKETSTAAVKGQETNVVAEFVKSAGEEASKLIAKGVALTGVKVDNTTQNTGTNNSGTNNGTTTTVLHKHSLTGSDVVTDYTRRTWDEQMAKTNPRDYASDTNLSVPTTK